MGTERIRALTALEDSGKPWRLEADKLLRVAINHKAATPFLGIARMDPRIYKSAAGDSRSIEFRVGEPSQHDTSDTSILGFSIKHNASGELEVFADNGGSPLGIKIASNGDVAVSGDTNFEGDAAFDGDVAFNGSFPNPLPGYPTFLTGSLTHDPPSLASGGDVYYTLNVDGLLQSKTPVVQCAMSPVNPSVIINVAWVSDDGEVTFIYHNYSGGSVNLPSTTVRAYCWQWG